MEGKSLAKGVGEEVEKFDENLHQTFKAEVKWKKKNLSDLTLKFL